MESSSHTITKLSLIIPCYQEEDALAPLRKELDRVLDPLAFACEIVAVDDGSTDATPSLLKAWAKEDDRVQVLIFSRNFGQQAAVTAGLEHCTGDAVLILDADLQDPPELIPRMIEMYEQGADMVYAQRRVRQGESFLKKATAFCFYRGMKFFMGYNLPPDTGDFRLMSRACLEAFLRMPERHRFLRGMFHWVGFKQAAIPFDRPERRHGETKYTFRKMLSLSLNAALSFSALPLRMILLVGMGVSFFGMAYGIYSVLRFFLVGDTVKGWPTLIVLITLLGGTTLVCLGIIGEYVSRIYDELKGRPLYLLKEIHHAGKKRES